MIWVRYAALLALPAACTAGDVHHRAEANISSDATFLSSTAQPIIRNADGSICYGPQPDSTVDDDTSMGTQCIGLGGSDNEIPLGGRNPNVLITRDIFFQACLAEARLNLNGAQRVDLFNRTLDLVRAVNTASLDGASVSSDSDSGDQQIYSPAAPDFNTTSTDATGLGRVSEVVEI